MDFDEFQESDIMFSDDSWDQSTDSSDSSDCQSRKHYKESDYSSRKMVKRRISNNIPKKQRTRMISSSSAPMNIPASTRFSRYDIDDDDDVVACSELFDDNGDNEDQMMGYLPPHLIVERRVNGEMARSFSPLKGKNLCEVRNSILRMTGFLER